MLRPRRVWRVEGGARARRAGLTPAACLPRASLPRAQAAQVAQIQAGLTPDASARDKARAAARAALTTMVASDALAQSAQQPQQQPAPALDAAAAPAAEARWFSCVRDKLAPTARR